MMYLFLIIHKKFLPKNVYELLHLILHLKISLWCPNNLIYNIHGQFQTRFGACVLTESPVVEGGTHHSVLPGVQDHTDAHKAAHLAPAVSDQRAHTVPRVVRLTEHHDTQVHLATVRPLHAPGKRRQEAEINIVSFVY